MPRISAEKKAEIVRLYLENNGMTYKDIAGRFGVSTDFVRRTVKAEVEAGNGIKPDRRAKPKPADWMEHVKPLNAHKRELELSVEHKQAELEAARQELRDFTATLRQLMEDTA